MPDVAQATSDIWVMVAVVGADRVVAAADQEAASVGADQIVAAAQLTTRLQLHGGADQAVAAAVVAGEANWALQLE